MGAMSTSAVAVRIAELLAATYAGCEDARGVDRRARSHGIAGGADHGTERTSSASFDTDGSGSGHASRECNIATDVHLRRMLGRLGTFSHHSTIGEFHAFVESAPKKNRSDLARHLMIHSRVVCSDPEPRCASMMSAVSSASVAASVSGAALTPPPMTSAVAERWLRRALEARRSLPVLVIRGETDLSEQKLVKMAIPMSCVGVSAEHEQHPGEYAYRADR